MNLYVERINQDNPILTTVLYPDGDAIGPHPGEDDRVREARRTGQARVDDVAGGAEILVPVSLGGSSAAPANTPVIRIVVPEPGLGSGSGAARRAGAGRARPGPAGRRAADGRPARPVVRRPDPAAGRLDPATRRGPPSRSRGGRRTTGGARARLDRSTASSGASTCCWSASARRSPTSRTGCAPRSPRCGCASTRSPPASDRARLGDDLDRLQLMVDHIVSEARRSEREGLVAVTPGVEVLAGRARFWAPLAEDQGRAFTLDTDVAGDGWSAPAGPTSRRCSTCFSTTSSPTPPRAPPWR